MEEDEVVSLLSRILKDSGEVAGQQESLILWRHFLSQTQDFKAVLEKRLTRGNWPVVMEGVGGERSLQLSVAGRCPSSCLMGLVVWLCECGHLDCRIVCSCPEGAASNSTLETVRSALEQKGWSIELLSSGEHCRQLQLKGTGLDLVMLGYPDAESPAWNKAVRNVRPGGCVVLVDAPSAASFTALECQSGMRYAAPVVVDRVQCGLEAFDECARRAIETLAASHAPHFDGLPVQTESRAATLFTTRRTPHDDLRPSPCRNQDSADLTEQILEGIQSRPEAEPEPGWKGSWRTRDDAGAVPSEFVFALLDRHPAGDDPQMDALAGYYDQHRGHAEPSRIELEGMGRPLLFRSCNGGPG